MGLVLDLLAGALNLLIHLAADLATEAWYAIRRRLHGAGSEG